MSSPPANKSPFDNNDIRMRWAYAGGLMSAVTTIAKHWGELTRSNFRGDVVFDVFVTGIILYIIFAVGGYLAATIFLHFKARPHDGISTVNAETSSNVTEKLTKDLSLAPHEQLTKTNNKKPNEKTDGNAWRWVGGLVVLGFIFFQLYGKNSTEYPPIDPSSLPIKQNDGPQSTYTPPAYNPPVYVRPVDPSPQPPPPPARVDAPTSSVTVTRQETYGSWLVSYLSSQNGNRGCAMAASKLLDGRRVTLGITRNLTPEKWFLYIDSTEHSLRHSIQIQVDDGQIFNLSHTNLDQIPSARSELQRYIAYYEINIAILSRIRAGRNLRAGSIQWSLVGSSAALNAIQRCGP